MALIEVLTPSFGLKQSKALNAGEIENGDGDARIDGLDAGKGNEMAKLLHLVSFPAGIFD